MPSEGRRPDLTCQSFSLSQPKFELLIIAPRQSQPDPNILSAEVTLFLFISTVSPGYFSDCIGRDPGASSIMHICSSPFYIFHVISEKQHLLSSSSPPVICIGRFHTHRHFFDPSSSFSTGSSNHIFSSYINNVLSSTYPMSHCENCHVEYGLT